MNLDTLLLIIVLFLLLLDIGAVLYILFSKWKHHQNRKKNASVTYFLLNHFSKATPDEIKEFLGTKQLKLIFLDQYIEMRQEIKVGSELDLKFKKVLEWSKLDTFFVNKLNSFGKSQKINAAIYLGYIGNTISRINLEQLLSKENNWLVKMYACSALMEINHKDSIPFIVATLPDSPKWYSHKVMIFLNEFGFSFHSYINTLFKSDNKNLKLAIVHFSREYIEEDLHEFLQCAVQDPDPDIARAAAESLYNQYPLDLNRSHFLHHSDPVISGFAIRSLGKKITDENIDTLVYLLDNETHFVNARAALIDIINNAPLVIDNLVNYCSKQINSTIKERLNKIISIKAEYFILRLQDKDNSKAFSILKGMIKLRQINAIMGFLSKNKDIEIENQILNVVREAIKEDNSAANLIQQFFDERLLKKLNLVRITPEIVSSERKDSKFNRPLLVVLLSAAILLFPLLFLIRHWNHLSESSIRRILELFILDGNYYLIFYSFTISCVYLILLFISVLGALKQKFYTNVKKKAFLFRKNVLPSITIIAPAYNEELTIIESVSSLLNVKYPDYEVIIVNDGSNDKTLYTLIDYYKLEKIDILYDAKIKTNPVRGIYKCRAINRLTIIDKVNGGKADSLNTGINLSSKEFFCGIDADSLLEDNAMLKIVSTSLDEDKETIAIGGNIFPINGCKVSRGVLEEVNLPKNWLINFQFIEYIRAFMAGRIGWSSVDCLLIISGAFGLFNKARVIECGGYLTSSGKYNKDTVGEDMELVVRLNRYMLEQKIPYSIKYSYNANCWTEVPGKMSILLRQRDRWHRGLIDILTFHMKLLCNPRYGRIGTVALPYFYLFEMMGPWIELQGYCMVIAALFLGLLNPTIAILLFISTTMVGIFISTASLIIAEQEVNYFKGKDILKLIFFAFIENFGFRQFMSMWRVVGYVNALRGASGWGKMQRKGFGGSK
jgi:cellulose synthase/poly-beta-1,6-N-acetylglucosamine synthase-like glycosyltransferase/HEAT repeat protein